ncbi:MAG TPA: cupin domain-containing protein [Patescibacteria group bacterium]|nr:cupin domain-containing protein [Patescibacteria group bacterium]
MQGYHINIGEEAITNTFFRKVLFTGIHCQLVVMSLKPGEEIGMETHPNVDQFFRIEAGEAKFIINKEETLTEAEDVVIIPAGSEHNVINTSSTEDLKLYTLYSPPNHPDGTINKTKQDAIAYEQSKDQ